MKLRLVRNARKGWLWFSNWAFAALASLPFVWPQIPPEVRDMIPPGWEPYIVSAIALGGVVGRMIDQGSDDA